jgi:GNAT superfamily N-acetyltransferase
MDFRPITCADIPALFVVRTATDENNLSREQLTRLGITEGSVREKLLGSYKGWLCEVDDQVVGFAMGDSRTGEMWVIAVLPEHVGKGVGSALLRHVEDWLWETGCRELWLTTDVDTHLRAYSFYRKHGWADAEIRDGLRYMKKARSASAPP